MTRDFVDDVRRAARKRIIYSEHALDRMNDEMELITTGEVREVLFAGEVIEEYPEDKRGHSCLMVARSSRERPVHVVCSPKPDYLGIITAYIPAAHRWDNNFRIRR